MGAQRWQRNPSGGSQVVTVGSIGPQTRSNGSQHTQPAGPRKRKAHVWRREENPSGSTNGQQHGPSQPSQPSQPLESLPAQSSSKRQRQDSDGDPEQLSSSQSIPQAADGQGASQPRASLEQPMHTEEHLRELKKKRQAEAQRQAADLQREAFLQQNRIAAQKVLRQAFNLR